jgi:hypothetical protein
MSGVGVNLDIQIKAHGLPTPVAEHRFHPTRKWRWDRAWTESMLAVEIHGGAWVQGRHVRGRGFSNDREKVNHGILLGWRCLEVTYDHINSGQAINWIVEALGEVEIGNN